MSSTWRRLAILCVALTAVFVIAGCGGSNGGDNSASSTESSSGTPQIDATNLPADFSAMAKLKDLASQGKGMIGVLLPDTTTSARYVQFDAPYLKQAFQAAGLSSDQFKIDNAQGSTSTMQTQAEADITAGATVLLVDALDPGQRRGDRVERRVQGRQGHRLRPPRDAAARRTATTSASTTWRSGKLIGQGEVDCIAAWKVAKPNDPGDGRRPDRQQRQALRPGLQRRARSRSSTTAPT